MNTNKTKAALLLTAFALTLPLTSCSSGGNSASSESLQPISAEELDPALVEEFGNDPVTLRFWNPITGPDSPFMQQLVSAYNNQYGNYINIKSDAQAEATHYQRILTSFTDESTADVCLIHKSRIASYVRSDKLRELDGIASTAKLDEKDYVGDTWSSSKINEKLYCIPYDVLPTLLYYNRNLIPEGYSEADILSEDFTMDTMYEMMKKAYVYAPTSLKTVYGMSFNYSYTESMFISLLNQQDETIVHADNPTEPTFANEKGYLAASKVREIPFTFDDAGHKVASESGADHLNIFDQGRALFTIDGVWSAPEACKKTAKVDAGVALMPKVSSGATRKVSSDGHCFASFTTSKPSEHKDKAIAHFISYMIDNTAVWCQGGKVSARADITKDESYLGLEWGYLSNKLDRLVSPVIAYTYTTIANPIGKYVARLCEGTLENVSEAIDQAASDARQDALSL